MIRILDELRELEQQEQRVLHALDCLRKEALQALEVDLPRFPEREVRRRFIAASGFARELSTEKVAEIKRALRQRSAELAEEVLQEMSDVEKWRAGIEHLEGEGKSLAQNPVLWEPTRRVVEFVSTVLETYGFPNAKEPPVEYRMPPYFIKGKYLPAIAEKYWGLLRELADIRRRLRELEEYRQKEELSRKWDEA